MWSRIKDFFLPVKNKFASTQISTKITVYYAVAFFLVLSVVSGVMGIGMYSSFYHQAEVDMSVSMQNVIGEIAKGKELDSRLLENDPLMPGVVLRITDISGSVIYENDAHYPTIDMVQQNLDEDTPFWANKNLQVADLDNMSIYYGKVVMVRNGYPYELHFFKTITAERGFLELMRQFLFLTSIIGLIVALTIGYFLSRSVLAPISKIIETAKKIEVTNLSQRLEVPPTKDELAELSKTINHMLGRLESGFKQQHQFVSNASHELRTPVTVIKGYVDMLARWGRDDKEILDEGIESIKSEAENMQQLIDKLLFLARADQKRQVINKESIDFAELVDDVVKKMKLVAKDHTIDLEKNDEAVIYGDEVLMRQLMRIFMDNALKYTPKGGKLTVSSILDDGRVIWRLTDTGIGIAKEDQEKVFDRFYRVDLSRTKVGGVGGTGLGLSIAKFIAETHDIEIGLESELGQGTTIILKIPTLE